MPNREAKSSGIENTYPEDLTDLDAIREEIAEMAAHAAGWLARKTLLARTVTIKVRYSDFTTITRSHTAPPTRDEARSSRAQCNCSTGPRPDAGRSGCSASACTISAEREGLPLFENLVIESSGHLVTV